MIDTQRHGQISVEELMNFLELSLGDMDEISIKAIEERIQTEYIKDGGTIDLLEFERIMMSVLD